MRTTGIVLLLLALAGCGGGASEGETASDAGSSPVSSVTESISTTFTVSGTFALTDRDGFFRYQGSCSGDGGYDDIDEGTQVVIRDGNETKVAIGALGAGFPSRGTCVFDFSVPDVPKGGGIYSVEVGHRGEVSFKETEANTLALTLG